MRAESSLVDVGYDSCTFVENPGDGVGEIALDLQGGNTPTLSRVTRGSLHQSARDVVSIPPIALDCVTRRQPFALVVEELADERTGHRAAGFALGANRMYAQKLLSLVPYRMLDDRLMLAGIARTLVADLANVNRVAEQGVERAACEGLL